ncbi:MAG: hypothetical protein PHF14_06080 [Verrucomicrobiota bacterium]|nr:hypothetical protein [Verrucomicrobiota bacterium]
MNHPPINYKLRVALLIAIFSHGLLQWTQAQNSPWGDILMRGFERKAIYAKTWVLVFTKQSEALAFSFLPYKGFGNTYPSRIYSSSDLNFHMEVAMDVEHIFYQGVAPKNNSPEQPNLQSVDWNSPNSVMETFSDLIDQFLEADQPNGLTIPIPLDSINTLSLPPPVIQIQKFLQVTPRGETRDLLREMTNLTNYYVEAVTGNLNAYYEYDATQTKPLTSEEISKVWNDVILPALDPRFVEINLIEDKGIAVFNFNKAFPLELWMSFSLKNLAPLPPLED